jgi:hypothetical protein
MLIIVRSGRATEEVRVVTQIKEAAVSTGLVMNESKIKFIKISRNITNLEEGLSLDLQILEGVQNCRYVGNLIK